MATFRYKIVFLIVLSFFTMKNHAEEGLKILQVLEDDFIEVRIDGEIKIKEMQRDKIGVPPIDVLAKDKMNFLLIKIPDGRKVWISASYVDTNGLKVRHNCSNMLTAKNSDNKIYGARGVGEECE